MLKPLKSCNYVPTKFGDSTLSDKPKPNLLCLKAETTMHIQDFVIIPITQNRKEHGRSFALANL